MKLEIFKLQLLQLENFVFFRKELGLSGNGTDETETEVRIAWMGREVKVLGDGLGSQKNPSKTNGWKPKKWRDRREVPAVWFGPGVLGGKHMMYWVCPPAQDSSDKCRF